MTRNRFFVTLFYTDKDPGYVVRGHPANDPDNMQFTRGGFILLDCTTLEDAEAAAPLLAEIVRQLVESGIDPKQLHDERDLIDDAWNAHQTVH